MYIDSQKVIIPLEEHPIMRKSISELDVDEQESAYLLLQEFIGYFTEHNFTQTDYFQMARIAYNLGELAVVLDYSKKTICSHYQAAFRYLAKGSLDLNIHNWMEILNLQTTGNSSHFE